MSLFKNSNSSNPETQAWIRNISTRVNNNSVNTRLLDNKTKQIGKLF